MNDKIKLSVIFITYNHERYVERALRSVLSQKTNFPFEVVVGEDCSTDATRDILKRVAEDYPEKKENIRLLLREKNLGRPTLNVYLTTKECRGEYLAYLEGDDYWTDEYKLEKQVDFLEEHPEYIACTHGLTMIDDEDRAIEDPEILKVGELYEWNGKFTYEDFKYSGKWPGHYATVVSRNIYPAEKYDYTILYRAHDFVDDAVILLFLLIQGDIFRMEERMSAWRYVRKKGGKNWNSLAMERNLIRDDCYLSQTMTKWVRKAVGLSEYAAIRAEKDFGTALKMWMKHPDRENYKFLKDMYDYNIREVVRPEGDPSLFSYSIRTILRGIRKKLS
ncbi:MAG: glycosyltransferase family 2 protein [Lachnospiraceae bacterium]|nr:glycosyltransferase family 2 protein [Lachnospiraceae bacterium]